MRSIVRASLRFRWIVLFLAAATLALGFIQIPETKVDVFPEFAPPQIEIQTIALGNSSNEVEQLITVPIEDQLGGIEGLSELRSKSVAQLSSIRLDLRTRRGRVEGPPTGAGAPLADHANPADVGQPTVHDAGALGDEPHHEDRSDLGYGQPDRSLGHRVLEDPVTPPPSAWGRTGRHLG